MKRIAKIMTVALLVIVAAISVSAAEVELSLTDAGAMGDYTSGVYYLDVVASDELYINVMDLKFTFNTEKVQLFCMDADMGYFPLNEDADPEWYAYAEYALVLGTNGKTGLQKATFSKAYVNATVDGTNCTAQFTANAPTGKVTKFPNEDFKVYQIGLYIPGDVTALTAEDFKIEHMYMGTWDGVESGVSNDYGYAGWSEPVAGQIAVTNNVVPEAEPITIPVLAGDKIYLQDGTVVTAAEAGDYEVASDVGYVAVNTGNASQKTYYIDGSTATQVHTNGVFESAYNTLRDKTHYIDNDGNDLGDRNGMRFKFNHNPQGRAVEGHEIVEVGFIMTAESAKVINAEGEDYVLDMPMVLRGTAKKGVAFDGKINVAMNTELDNLWVMSATFYNIPLTEAGVQIPIVSRPYYKVGETYIYGEVVKNTLYDAATNIKNSASWDDCSESMQEYVNEIIGLVDGYEEIIEDEVIIDIGSLYEDL